jgi:hypothetical protein
MSLTVDQRPSKTVSGDVSKWNAVKNPILYKMTRKDYSFNQANNSGGFMQMQFTGVNIASSFSIGDSVYANSRGFATVTASSFSGGNTLVNLDASFTSSASGFVNNFTKRSGYQVQVEVWNAAGQIGLISYSYTPDKYGFVTINVSAIVQKQLSEDINIVFGTDSVVQDNTGFTDFYIKYREVWIGSAESQTNDSSNVFYACNAARQIPSLHGGNMYEYVSWDDGVPQCRWINLFTVPRMWRGFPFVLSAIVGDTLTSNVSVSVVYKNSQGGTISTALSSGVSLTGKLIFVEVTEISPIPDNAKTVVVDLIRSTGSNLLTLTMVCEIYDPCDNPIMLMARNSLGGVLQWCFDANQEDGYDFGNSIKNNRKVLYAEHLTKNEWDCLQDFIRLGEVYRDNVLEFTADTIKTSSRVGQQVYVVQEDGSKIGVIVIPTKNKTETKFAVHKFEIEIEYPDIF